jgi:hypoxanthine phosphoribosyltransferase
MTPSQLSVATDLLAATAAERFGHIDQVIAVARGGLRPADAIADLLGARLRVVHARHNPTSAPYTQATGHVTCTVTGIEPGRLDGSILIVDDICGTGMTLHTVTGILTRLAAPGTQLHTATLCRNAGSPARPGLTVWDDLREWVIFPWEPPPPLGTAVATLPDPAKAHAA